MDDFATLSCDEQAGLIRSLAFAALSQYGMNKPEVLLLQHSMNTVFAVIDRYGEIGNQDAKYVLRVHPERWLCPEEIASEPVFLAAASAAGLPVSRPVMGLNGRYMQAVAADGVPGKRCTILFHWMDGEILSEPMNRDRLLAAGKLTAQLHDFSKCWIPPEGFRRPSLAVGDLFCDGGMFDPREGRQLFSPSQADVFSAAIEKISGKLSELHHDADNSGLVHGDVYFRNLIAGSEGLGLIDFDMLGWAHFNFDLVMPYWPEGQGDGKEATEVLLEGYAQLRKPPAGVLEHYDDYKVLRRLFEAYFLVSGQHHPQFREWTPGALVYIEGQAMKYLGVSPQ